MFWLMGATSADNLVHYEDRMLSSKCAHTSTKYVLNNECSHRNLTGSEMP